MTSTQRTIHLALHIALGAVMLLPILLAPVMRG